MTNKEIMEKVVGTGATVLGGVAFKPIDGMLNKVSFLSSVSSVNPNAASAKFIKTGLWTVLAIGAEVMGPSYIKGKNGEMITNAAGRFFSGMAAATYAADPVIQTFPATYVAASSNQPVQAVRQSTVRTGNIIS